MQSDGVSVLVDPALGLDWPGIASGDLTLSLARNQEELFALQRLRYRVFTEELGARFPEAEGDRDVDRFDRWCLHFRVCEADRDQVVGTYRLLTPEAARQAGGYYSETEFDLTPLEPWRPLLVEVGRSCIDPAFRHGRAIMLLWTGLAQIMMRGGYRYMLGCASVSVRADERAAAAVWQRARRLMATHPDVPRLRPHVPYPVARLEQSATGRIPPLIKGYLQLGCTICGPPAWDPLFQTADFPILLDLEWLDSRYRRHFGMEV